MTDPIIGGILNWIHVVSAIGWLGAAMLFAMILAPTLSTFSPAGRGEFIVKLFPKFARYVPMVAVSTLVFGGALYYYMAAGDSSAYTSQWGVSIMAGAVLALVAAVLAIAIVIPAMNKMVRLVKEMQANPTSPPSPEVPKILRRLRMASVSGLVLLMLVVVFMVAAAWAP